MRKKRIVCVLLFCFFALIMFMGSKAEAKYPLKTVKLITHSSPGGGTDLFLRQAIKYLGPDMGVTFVVENVKGSGGAVAVAAVAQAPADGGTFYGATPTFLIGSLVSQTKYTYRDLDPVVNVFFDPMVAYCKVDSQFKSLKEAVDYAKKNPGKGKWGTGTPASLEQQIAQSLKRIAGITDVAIVSFEGGGDEVMNVMGGRLDFGMGEPSEIMPQVEAGKIRILATFTESRLENMPKVPTAKEQGMDIVITKFRGLVGPKGLPAEVVKAWEEAIPRLLANPQYKALYTQESLVPAFMGQKTFQPYIQKRNADIENFFREMGILKK